MVEQEQMDKNFWRRLPLAFAYPFRGDGAYVLLTGVIGLFILNIISAALAATIFGVAISFLIGLFIAGFLCAFMIKIIGDTAKGKSTPPSFADVGLTDFRDDILGPAYQVLGTLAFCFAPAIVASLLLHYKGMGNWALVVVLLACGALYLPMGLMMVALSGMLSELNPLVVIRAILRIPLQYLGAVIFFFFVIGLRVLTKYVVDFEIPVISGLANSFIFLYFLLVAMHILGLLAYCNSEKLWPR